MARSIRTRILLISVFSLLVSLALSGALNYLVAQRFNDDAIRQSLQAVANGNATGIDEWVASKRRALSSLQNASLSTDPMPSFNVVTAADGFLSVYSGYPDRSFKVPHPEQLPPTYDPTLRPWYKLAAAKRESVVTAPYMSSNGRGLVVSIAVPVVRKAELQAVIGGDIAMDAVVANVKAIHPTPNSFAFLVNEAGSIIASPDDTSTLKSTNDIYPGLDLAKLRSGRNSAEMQEIEVDGAAKLVHLKHISGTDWDLAVALDKNDATAGIRRMIGTSIGVLIVVTLLATVVVGTMTSKAFRRLLFVRQAMDDIGSGSGDLTARLPSDGDDEVSQIARSFNAFSDKLTTVLRRIAQGSDSVRTAARDIASGNADLASRTENQASSLEETSSSMEQLTSIVRLNAENARHASSLADNASQVAALGGEVVSNVVTTMKDINQSSTKIAEIIRVIESIAFQTNILALNAAVEAARAAEQGRGFAVVATEVRALAQRSAKAAKEIKQLIEESVSRVSNGTQLVNQAGATMTEIVGSVDAVSAIMRQISVSSDEQSQSIGQVNDVVKQMEHMTQQNAALVEEAAAAAESLQEQAVNLNDAIAAFRLS